MHCRTFRDALPPYSVESRPGTFIFVSLAAILLNCSSAASRSSVISVARTSGEGKESVSVQVLSVGVTDEGALLLGVPLVFTHEVVPGELTDGGAQRHDS
jgi:hypothetical protein